MAQCVDGAIALAPILTAIFLGVSVESRMALPLYYLGLPWLFFHVMLADGMRGGQSVGKRFFSIRVVDAQSGQPCTFGQSFIRNIILSALGPIDWTFILGERHQRLGDRAAGTIVIPAV